MIGKRYIDGDKLLGLIDQCAPKLHGGARTAIERWLKRQPKAPKLIGRQRAAELLGVTSPYISVLEKKGDMPKPIKVEGGKDAYDEAEVKALAKQRAKEAAVKKVAT
jgi:predicted DNA-binding transcriptional regulator AlpA